MFVLIVLSVVLLGDVSLLMVYCLLWKVVCFWKRGGGFAVASVCSVCCGCLAFCLSCEACSLRCRLTGKIFVSVCKCCVLVSRVQPVIVLSALFCVIWILFVCVCEMMGDHMVLAYSRMGLVIVL